MAQDATSDGGDRAGASARNQASFHAKVGDYDLVIFSRLLEGPYPNVDQVIPKENPKALIGQPRRRACRDRPRLDPLRQHHAPGSLRDRAGQGDVPGQHDRRRFPGRSRSTPSTRARRWSSATTPTTCSTSSRASTASRSASGSTADQRGRVVEPEGGLPEEEEELLCLIMPLRLPDSADSSPAKAAAGVS